MGCAAALDDDASGDVAHRARCRRVERVVGGADLDAIAGALGTRAASARRADDARRPGRARCCAIQDGCDEHCTFCATTLARGANRSRPIDELVREATALAERHPEIVITGIHIGTYGADIGSSLGALDGAARARRAASCAFGCRRSRRPRWTIALVALLAGAPERLAPHVHAPLQSGSDRVLKRMGRHWYTRASYAAAIERSGEPHADPRTRRRRHRRVPRRDRRRSRGHGRARSSELPFTYLHVFPYSARPGTAAERLRRPRARRRRSPNARRELRDARPTKGGDVRRRASRRAGATSSSSAAAPNAKGLTGDYLDVRLADPSFARGDRFVARLSRPATRCARCPASKRGSRSE